MSPRGESEASQPSLAQTMLRVLEVARTSSELVARILQNSGKLVGDALTDSASIVRDVTALGSSAAGTATAIDLELNQDVGALAAMVRATPRMARIVSELLKVAASYRFHRARSDLARIDPSHQSMAELHRTNAERLYQLCVELRGAVLKVGQLASSRADLLPLPYIERLSQLQDQVPPVPWEAIAERIESELGAPLSECYAEVSREPLAAASLAQVHAARLLDGSPVVIKVLMPGIENLVATDLAALRVLASLLKDRLPQVDLDTIARELSRSVALELDFVEEARNAEAFAADFADDPTVVIPRVVHTHSSSRVLTLARLDGPKITDYLAQCEADGEPGSQRRDRLLETLVRCTARQVMEHGRFHADPHPGNLLVLEGVELGLVDFGSVLTLSSEERRAYAQLAGAMLGGDEVEMATQLAVLGFRTRSDGDGDLERFAGAVIEGFRADLWADIAHADAFDQFQRGVAIARNHPGLLIPQAVVQLGRVFAALGGVIMRYKPRLNLAQILLPYLANAMS